MCHSHIPRRCVFPLAKMTILYISKLSNLSDDVLRSGWKFIDSEGRNSYEKCTAALSFIQPFIPLARVKIEEKNTRLAYIGFDLPPAERDMRSPWALYKSGGISNDRWSGTDLIYPMPESEKESVVPYESLRKAVSSLDIGDKRRILKQFYKGCDIKVLSSCRIDGEPYIRFLLRQSK